MFSFKSIAAFALAFVAVAVQAAPGYERCPPGTTVTVTITDTVTIGGPTPTHKPTYTPTHSVPAHPTYTHTPPPASHPTYKPPTTRPPKPTTTVTVAPAPAPVSQCNTGPVQCCNSVQKASDPSVAGLAGLLGIVIENLDVLVGVQCSPIVNIVGGGASCSAHPVCCENNTQNGLINIGCSPISLN